jgi:hypothetical protein
MGDFLIEISLFLFGKKVYMGYSRRAQAHKSSRSQKTTLQNFESKLSK